MPEVVVIAGPNGAGKSTFAPDLLTKHYSSIPFLNADSIAETLSNQSNPEIKAGRIMLTRMRAYARSQKSFAYETTLSAKTYLRFLNDIQKVGYSVEIAFLWLPDVELSIQRVAERVRIGGHDIPIDTVRRRFDRGRKNFLALYMPIADGWRFYDASMDIPRIIASGGKLVETSISDEELWKKISK